MRLASASQASRRVATSLTAHVSTAWRKHAYASVDAADAFSPRPDFSIFMYPWMLLPDNKIPPWGAAYALADEFSGEGIFGRHPVSAFIQNEDDTEAPVQGTLAYVQKVHSVAGNRGSSVHVYNFGGHGFGLCQGTTWKEVCDWPKVAQRFLQDHGLAPGWPQGPPDDASMVSQGCDAP